MGEAAAVTSLREFYSLRDGSEFKPSTSRPPAPSGNHGYREEPGMPFISWHYHPLSCGRTPVRTPITGPTTAHPPDPHDEATDHDPA